MAFRPNRDVVRQHFEAVYPGRPIPRFLARDPEVERTLRSVGALRDEAVGSSANRDGKRKRWALKPYCQFTLERTEDGEEYLKRWWLIDTPMGGIALHRMRERDARDTVHDHPFGFVSVILRGGYSEVRRDPLSTGGTTLRRYGARSGGGHRVNFMRRSDAHTIVSLLRVPTWTLLFCGPNRRRWGFLQPTNDGYVWTDHERFDSGHYVP